MDHGDMSHDGPFGGAQHIVGHVPGANNVPAPAPGRVGGRGRGGRGRGRNGGRGRHAGNRQRDRRIPARPFLGNTDGMKGNVFQCHGESLIRQQFLKTVGVLEEHINKTFTYPEDVASVCKKFEIVVPL